MLCREFSLVNRGEGYAVAIPLECRSWGCEYCQPKRQKALQRLAASGAPNRFITLTHRPDLDTHRDRRAHNLARAWRLIIARIKRQYGKLPEDRWQLKPLNDDDKKDQTKVEKRVLRNKRVSKICQKDEKTAPLDTAYLAVFEAHKSGEPHLHILFRGRYIPQDWLSEQCNEILHSPICDIRRIWNTKQAALYISKYTGKAPHKFGTNKRYWHTANYTLHQIDEEIENPYQGLRWEIREINIIDLYIQWSQGRDNMRVEGNFDRIWYGTPPPTKREAAKLWEREMT